MLKFLMCVNLQNTHSSTVSYSLSSPLSSSSVYLFRAKLALSCEGSHITYLIHFSSHLFLVSHLSTKSPLSEG